MTLPNFLIAGERRSGTTTLAKWIEAHPDIYLHPTMDMGFFIDDAISGRREWLEGEPDYEAWNKNHSAKDYAARFSEATGTKAIGEKSADYLFWKPAHSRMREIVPDAKIILCLRHPVERAWSMYWNEVGKGRESLSFEEAIAAEEERIAGSAYARDHMSYLHRGFYDESISELYKTFPPEQVLVIIHEHMRQDPETSLREVYNFLNIDINEGLDRAGNRYNSNWTSVPRAFWQKNKLLIKTEAGINQLIRTAVKLVFRDIYSRRRWITRLEGPFRNTKKDFEMSAQMRQKLLEVYRPHTGKLEAMLNVDLTAWKK